MKRALVIFLPLAAIVLAIGYRAWQSRFNDSVSGWNPFNPEIPVKVLRVKKRVVVSIAKTDGELQPAKEIEITSRLPGFLKEVRFKVGDRVTAGTVVATVQSDDVMNRLRASEEELKQAEADLREKEKQLLSAEKELVTARQFYEKGLIARRRVDEAGTSVNTAHAQRELAQARLEQRESMLEQARYLLNLTRLVTPMGGRVARRWVEAGARVSASTTVLSIADLETMRIMVPIASRDAAFLSPGMTLRLHVDGFPGRLFDGTVVYNNIASESADRVTAEIHVANSEGLLKSGMKASLSLPETREALLVPRDCVLELQNKSYLYVVINGRAQRRAVVTQGLEQDGSVAITSGLEPGDAVVVAGMDRLEPNRAVRVLE